MTKRLCLISVTWLLLAGTTWARQAPDPAAGEGAGPEAGRPAADPSRPAEDPSRRAAPALPDDRPFTGDPGGEPPPPPVKPTPERRATPPGTPPRKPAPPKKPAPDKNEWPDLIDPQGPNVITAGVGFTAGLTRHSVGGFQLNLGWSYQMTRLVWFDVVGNFNAGGACQVVERDANNRVIDADCGSFRGIGVDLLAGIQLKFVSIKLWRAPVVPFVRFAAGVAFIITDTPTDGAALVFRVGGGARYYFTRWFSLGGELAVTLGPAWRNHLDTSLYADIAVLAGVEFLF